jgi:DNA recombination protein RmuC
MDIASLSVGVLLGVTVGAIVAATLVRARAAAGNAVMKAQFDALGADHGVVIAERDRLRVDGARHMTAAAAAESKAQAAHARIDQLERAVSAEQARAREADEERGRVVASLRALEATLVEREKSFEEARATIEDSRKQLSDAFKATGSEVLKEAADVLRKDAKAQFEDHHKLSQQDLENRQKAIDSALMPLREQLQKQEKLVQDLREKGEGDAKALAEQLKNIAQLQQEASKAANTLSSAMRDNRQRGRWGELALRNIVEKAGAHASRRLRRAVGSDRRRRRAPAARSDRPSSRKADRSRRFEGPAQCVPRFRRSRTLGRRTAASSFGPRGSGA